MYHGSPSKSGEMMLGTFQYQGKRFEGTGLDTISCGESHHRSDKRVYEYSYRGQSVKH